MAGQEKLSRDALNRFKDRLRRDLGSDILGMNSYDQTYTSDIKLFTDERHYRRVLDYLHSIGAGRVSESHSSVTHMRYRHGADVLISFYYPFRGVPEAVPPPPAMRDQFTALSNVIRLRVESLINTDYRNLMGAGEAAAVSNAIARISQALNSIRNYPDIDSAGIAALENLNVEIGRVESTIRDAAAARYALADNYAVSSIVFRIERKLNEFQQMYYQHRDELVAAGYQNALGFVRRAEAELERLKQPSAAGRLEMLRKLETAVDASTANLEAQIQSARLGQRTLF